MLKPIASILLLIPFALQAQTKQALPDSQDSIAALKQYPKGKNIIKTNLSSLVFNNYSITYERRVANRISLSVGYRYMPNGSLPFQSRVKDVIKSNNIDFDNFQIGGYAVTPELRLYAHRNMRGFYIAPYVRYSSMDLTVPVQYTSTVTKEALFSGTITAFSGGLMLGTQHNIFKNCVIDIWIIGANFGNSSGRLNATFAPPMSAQEQTALQSSIDQIDATPYKVTGKVSSSTTAYLDASGPWLGVRAMGINFGIRF